MFKDSSNQAEFELLIRATRNELFHFIIVQYQHLDLVRTVKNDLKVQYPERPFAEFNLENINSETFIHSILACKTGFIFIEKFELFFQEDLQALAIGFNQRRDLFSTFPIQLIVFVPLGGDTLLHFQKTMPDFYSILNLSISLKSEILLEENLQSRIPFDITNNDYDNVEEAKNEIERIEKRLKTLEDTPENTSLRYELIIQLANAYRFSADYLKSRELYEKLLHNFEQQNDISLETVIANIQNNLALVLQDLGDDMGAKVLLEKAINSAEKYYGVDHSITATGYANLASVLRALRDYEGAKELIIKAINSDKKNLHEEHPTTAIHFSILATILQDLGDYDGAKKILEQVKNIAEKTIGQEHFITASFYTNLATSLQNLGDYVGAKQLLEKALRADEEKMGINHPLTAINYSNLATILEKLGDYDKAMTLYDKAYQILLKHLGEQHPYTKIVEGNLDFAKQKNSIN
ncbi:tetratricopeptide repeat protein [Arcicella sp. DC2W]|uniref:Tetratricopeptide repeat protein n=1 Tax=Arcicella gelida TaxID=2984195 RepID=A0ABU5S116_9BACT|nr:tetratricopeptide repeat protein [Arcicella sp. DC2W]MEA5402172.1 tetratricopeptide repeat protein [Arcicella sp. DC2W]